MIWAFLIPFGGAAQSVRETLKLSEFIFGMIFPFIPFFIYFQLIYLIPFGGAAQSAQEALKTSEDREFELEHCWFQDIEKHEYWGKIHPLCETKIEKK